MPSGSHPVAPKLRLLQQGCATWQGPTRRPTACARAGLGRAQGASARPESGAKHSSPPGDHRGGALASPRGRLRVYGSWPGAADDKPSSRCAPRRGMVLHTLARVSSWCRAPGIGWCGGVGEATPSPQRRTPGTDGRRRSTTWRDSALGESVGEPLLECRHVSAGENQPPLCVLCPACRAAGAAAAYHTPNKWKRDKLVSLCAIWILLSFFFF